MMNTQIRKTQAKIVKAEKIPNSWNVKKSRKNEEKENVVQII